MYLPTLRVSRASFYAIEFISFVLVLSYVICTFNRDNLPLESTSIISKPELESSSSFLSLDIQLEQNNQWEPPLSFDSQLSQFHRDDNFTQEQLQYPWYRPLVYLHSTRPSYKNESERVIYLYSQGLRLGGIEGFQRNFTVVGCLVGETVYPISFTSGEEIYICRVHHNIDDGEFLSVVVQGDEYVQRALTLEPVELNHGMKVALRTEDLNPISDHYHITSEVKYHSKGMKLYYARSTVKFQSNLEMIPVHGRKKKVRYEICGCTQNKLYPHLTAPWVDYHRRIGMDFIFIIDNNATKDLQDTFKDRSDVQVYFWPYAKSQVQIWSYIFQLALTKCEWLFLFDPDEYIMLGIGKSNYYGRRNPLKMYTNKLRKNGTVAVAMYYTLMEGSGQLEIPRAAPPEIYVHAFPHQFREGKMMIRTDYPWTRASVHRHYNMHNQVPTASKGLVETEHGIAANPIEIDGIPTLAHYKRRSWKEWKIKSVNERATLLLTDKYDTDSTAMNEFLKEKSDDLIHTRFQSIWNAVVTIANRDFQTLVKTENGKRCTALITASSKFVVRKHCKDIEQEKEDIHNELREKRI